MVKVESVILSSFVNHLVDHIPVGNLSSLSLSSYHDHYHLQNHHCHLFSPSVHRLVDNILQVIILSPTKTAFIARLSIIGSLITLLI